LVAGLPFRAGKRFMLGEKKSLTRINKNNKRDKKMLAMPYG